MVRVEAGDHRGHRGGRPRRRADRLVEAGAAGGELVDRPRVQEARAVAAEMVGAEGVGDVDDDVHGAADCSDDVESLPPGRACATIREPIGDNDQPSQRDRYRSRPARRRPPAGRSPALEPPRTGPSMRSTEAVAPYRLPRSPPLLGARRRRRAWPCRAFPDLVAPLAALDAPPRGARGSSALTVRHRRRRCSSASATRATSHCRASSPALGPGRDDLPLVARRGRLPLAYRLSPTSSKCSPSSSRRAAPNTPTAIVVHAGRRVEEEKRLETPPAPGRTRCTATPAIPTDLQAWPAHWLEASGSTSGPRATRGDSHDRRARRRRRSRPVTGRIAGTVTRLVGIGAGRGRARRRRHTAGGRLVPRGDEPVGACAQAAVRVRGHARGPGARRLSTSPAASGDLVQPADGEAREAHAPAVETFRRASVNTGPRRWRPRSVRSMLPQVPRAPPQAAVFRLERHDASAALRALRALRRRHDLLGRERGRAARDPLVRADDDGERDAHRARRVLQLRADRPGGVLRRGRRRPARVPDDERGGRPRELGAQWPRSRCCTRRSGSSSGSSWRSSSSERCSTRPERPRAQRSSPTSSRRQGSAWSARPGSARGPSRAPSSWALRSGACSWPRSAPPAPSGSTPRASSSRPRSSMIFVPRPHARRRARSAAASSKSWPRECGSSGIGDSPARSSRWSCSRTWSRRRARSS